MAQPPRSGKSAGGIRFCQLFERSTFALAVRAAFFGTGFTLGAIFAFAGGAFSFRASLTRLHATGAGCDQKGNECDREEKKCFHILKFSDFNNGT